MASGQASLTAAGGRCSGQRRHHSWRKHVFQIRKLQAVLAFIKRSWLRQLDLVELPFACFRTAVAACVFIGALPLPWIVPSLGMQALHWELQACGRLGWKFHFGNIWNYLDIVSISAMISLPIWALCATSTEFLLVPFLAMACLLLAVRLLSILRAFESFGLLVRMVLSSVDVMKQFMVLMLVVLLGLSFAWSVLAAAFPDKHFLQEEDTTVCEPLINSSFACSSRAQKFAHHMWRVLAAFNLMYRLAVLGDFPGDAFALADVS